MASPEGAGTTGVGLQPEPSSFSVTQILSVASVVLSLAGLYYKRKELMAFVNKPKPAQRSEATQNKQPQITSLRLAPLGLPVRIKPMD